MKKSLALFFIILTSSLIFFLIVLSTTGIKTKKFNTLISNKINQNNKDFQIKLSTINFKLDPENLKLFLATESPIINYRNNKIPTKNLRVYIDFLSLIKAEPKIERINLVLKQFDVKNLKEFSKVIKPSNYTNFLKNNLKEGNFNSEVEIYLKDGNFLDDIIVRGSASNLKAIITKGLELKSANFTFFADKSDILVKNFFAETELAKIEDGDLKINFHSGTFLETNFQSMIRYENQKGYNSPFLRNFRYTNNIQFFKAKLQNSFSLDFDKTFKLKDYSFKLNGKIDKLIFEFDKPFKNYLSSNNINQLSLIDTNMQTNFSYKEKNLNLDGEYTINDRGKKLKFKSNSKENKQVLNLKVDFEFDQLINFDIINYVKKDDKLANISLDLDKKNNDLKINEFIFKEDKNLFLLKNLKLHNNKFKSFNEVSVRTFKDKKINNDFQISYKDKIMIVGTNFDATNFPKIFDKNNDDKTFTYLNDNIEIDLKNIIVPLSEKIINFRLIGKIENGKFTKISSKGNFSENTFLDISMKQNMNNKKKYLEIYSDRSKPFLTEYNFFNGLSGGKLIFSSIIDQTTSSSKLRIEKFKVVNAPAMVKLFSLADLGGLADLAEGEGISFDILDISFEKDKDNLKLNEILALGPSISVLMEGYQNSEVTSLRGTLVPAKTLNKIISKIPIIGDIVIPNEVGEGLFGISFKMKGPPGKIKTTINPIKSITPRFIQKIIKRDKEIK